MAFKHQDQSYRTRFGVRYECAEDICDTSKGDLQWQAHEKVRHFRLCGRQAFFEKQDGFYRIFAEVQ